jgi:hypothetical protein
VYLTYHHFPREILSPRYAGDYVRSACKILLISACLLVAAALAADFSARLARWKRVNMPLDISSLDLSQRQVVSTLIQAAQNIESIYWRQSDPAALRLYLTTKDQNLKRMLMINGGRYDLIDDNRPFVGDKPASPGRALYPAGLTREEIEQYVKQHPGQRDSIYSPYTVIIRYGSGLQAIPYHTLYGPWLTPAANHLRDAANLTHDAYFAKFLRLRADALLSDDYYPSDLAWMDLNKPKIDVIFAPYETYLDGVLGVKTSYEAAILIRNDAESARLEMYQQYVPQMQDALPIDHQDLPSKKGQPSPMEVVDAPFRTGDLLHGYQAVADNLPNDSRIHERKGTKKIFFKNFLDARVQYVVLPVAEQMMPREQATLASGGGYLAAVVLHEISHGLGPAYSRVNGRREDIRASVGPIYAALEEAKADVVGMYCVAWLIDHKVLPASRAHEYYASYVAGIFRSVRYGIAEAHGRAEMMEFNYLVSQNAIVARDGKYEVAFDRIPGALAALSKELLTIEATGDRARAEHWFEHYDKIPPDLKQSLARITGVPVDIEPVFSVPVLPR